jgi:prepilin-type N-terminal cleavage/methylation domain-containing protein
VPVKTQKKSQSGFTVIEVLIALFMIGVTVMLFQATANSVVLNKYGRYREIALRIADKKIQTVRTTAFASIPATGSFADPLLSTIPSGTAVMTTTDINNNLKDVRIVITWRRPDNSSTQRVQLQTYIYRGGLGQ